MLDYESHRLLQDFCSTLNKFYIDHPQLWADDHTWSGFEWIDATDTVNNVFIYARKSPNPKENDIYVTLNMVPQPLESYKIPVYEEGKYQIVINTDDMSFGGSGYPTATDVNGCFETIDEPYNGFPYHVEINLPPMAGIYFMKVGEVTKKPAKKPAKVKAKTEAKAKSTTAKKAPAKKVAKKTAPKTETKAVKAKKADNNDIKKN